MTTWMAIFFQLVDSCKRPPVAGAPFVARREQERILDLFGKLDWDEEFDYKRERHRR